MMSDVPVDLITVAIAAILNMLISYVWYSKWLFAAQFYTARGEIYRNVEKRASTLVSFVASAMISVAVAYFLTYFQSYLGITTVTEGMFLGFWVWLGFVLTTQVSTLVWGHRSFKLFVLDAGGRLLAYLVMGGVIGA